MTPKCEKNCIFVLFYGLKKPPWHREDERLYPECKEYCDEHGIEVLYIEGANHALEVEGKLFESLEILRDVMEYVDKQKEIKCESVTMAE